MRNTIRFFSTMAAFAVAGAFVRSPLAAQNTMLLSAPTPNTRVAEALQLEASARQEKYTTRDWQTAASAFEHAASLRGAKDPAALDDLFAAADAYELLDRPTVARNVLDRAGREAEGMGNVDMAVRAYAGAFRLAMQLDNEDMANSYLDRLSALSHSPRLSAETRKEFLGPVAPALSRGGR
jgi:hypothetical protein